MRPPPPRPGFWVLGLPNPKTRLVLPAALKRSWYWTCSGINEPSPEASWLQQAVVYTTCGEGGGHHIIMVW